MNWQNKTTVQKGNFGEQIVREYLEAKGFIVYMPETVGAHAFDRLAIKDKKQMLIAEVKTKARRNHYPDTGVDARHIKTYQLIETKHNIPVYLFFIDEMVGQVYGQRLALLMEKEGKYPLNQKGIIYFPLNKMKIIRELNETEVLKLKNLSSRKHEYKIMRMNH